MLAGAFFLNTFKRTQDLKKDEIARMNRYLLAESGYSIKEIPEWVSLAPVSKTKELSYPQYVIHRDGTDQMGQGEFIYYYPFANLKEAEACYSLLSPEEAEAYDLISCSLLYPSERNQEYIELLEIIKKYYDMANDRFSKEYRLPLQNDYGKTV